MADMPRKRWSNPFKSFTQKRIDNNLGIIPAANVGQQLEVFRCKDLERLDSYYESRQYDKLEPWDSETGAYVPIRKRKPRIVFNFSKVLAQRITSKLIGSAVWPALKVEDDPDTQEYISFIIKAAKLKALLLEPIRRLLISGSVLVRYYCDNGVFVLEHYNSKYCYPTLAPNGELTAVEIKYVYTDDDDKDERGNPKRKWYKLDLGPMVDILYDNPDYKPNIEPQFEEVSRAEHNLGFVQAEWFRTSIEKHTPDGDSLISEITDFIDELNYNLSQSSQAVAYNQDPQLVIKNMTEDELDSLIRSSQKAWNLGREGEADFLESTLNGVKTAEELRDKVRLGIQDIARLVLLDPEKMVGHAQSGKAMEVLHGPMVDLIMELRPMIEDRLVALITKLAVTNLILTQRGEPAPVSVPPGYQPQDFNITLTWPPVFQQTMEDLQKKVQVATILTNASIFSREWAARWLAQDFGVEDVELELQRVAAQPIINPFSSF